MYLKLYIDTEYIYRACDGLLELAALKRSLPEVGTEQIEQARLLEIAAKQIREAAQYAGQEPTPHEQLQALEKLAQELSHTAGYGFGSQSISEKLRSYAHTIADQRQRAYSTLAAFVEEQKNRLLAIKFIINSAMNSATHREKNTRLQIAVESLDAISLELFGLNMDSYFLFEMNDGGWDIRKLSSEIHILKSQLADANKKLEQYQKPESENV